MNACTSKPRADFSISPEHPKMGEHAQFINHFDNAKYFSWNFGDSSMSLDEDGAYAKVNPSHVFISTGKFVVHLPRRMESNSILSR